MSPSAVILAVCCLAATTEARPGHHGGGGGGPLVGVPDISSFSGLSYPKYDILDLGTDIKSDVPPAVVHIHSKSTIEVPKPYVVKIPHPVAVPVPVAKPYPVVETKIIKVPQPYPVEVVKKVPVPYEVPKPYPIPAAEYKGIYAASSGDSYGGSFQGYGQGGLQHLDQQNEDQGAGDGPVGVGFHQSFEGGQGGFGNDHEQAAQYTGASGDFGAGADLQQEAWQGNPAADGYDVGAGNEEQH